MTECEILDMLREHGPLTVAAMNSIRVKISISRLRPFWRRMTWVRFLVELAHGNLSEVYPTLYRLERRGAIGSRWIDPLPGSNHRRREYFVNE